MFRGCARPEGDVLWHRRCWARSWPLQWSSQPLSMSPSWSLSQSHDIFLSRTTSKSQPTSTAEQAIFQESTGSPLRVPPRPHSRPFGQTTTKSLLTSTEPRRSRLAHLFKPHQDHAVDLLARQSQDSNLSQNSSLKSLAETHLHPEAV